MEPELPSLPKPPDDPERLRRLREEALARMKVDERKAPAPVYGSPVMLRRRSFRTLFIAILAAIAAIAAWFGFRKTIPLAVYGGPPPPRPTPPEPK
jgi:hypothetical protein